MQTSANNLNLYHFSIPHLATFNTHFTEKIKNLKEKTDLVNVDDPLIRLKRRLANSSAKFNLKVLTTESVSAAFKKIKKKKSSGSIFHYKNMHLFKIYRE